MTEAVLRGQTALVTGASSGIGLEIARELARLGCGLILAARRFDRLQSAQREIQQAFGVPVEIYSVDLAGEEARLQLYQAIVNSGGQVDILINNAGFAIFGDYASVAWERERELLNINILALTHLTRLFLPGMLQRKHGYILLMASVQGYTPVPPYTTYAASKSYVVNYAHSLRHNLRSTGVSVTVSAPGATESEFLQVSGQRPSLYERLTMMKAEDVARISVKAMLQRRASVVPGWINQSTIFFTRFVPRHWLAGITDWLMKKM
jgi:uncharacterized protein